MILSNHIHSFTHSLIDRQYFINRYRPPECLICEGYYNYKMDIWGAGCVLFEMLTKNPIFPGSNEIDQLHRIHLVIGSPSKLTLQKIMMG